MPKFKRPSTPPPTSPVGDSTASGTGFWGDSDLPCYITEILKDLLRVLAIRATHMSRFLELLYLLQGCAHRVAHKLVAGPQNRKALFVALGTVPRERERRDSVTATGIRNSVLRAEPRKLLTTASRQPMPATATASFYDPPSQGDLLSSPPPIPLLGKI